MRSCCVLLSSSVICPCTHKLHNTRAHFYCLSSMSVIVYMCFRHCHLITSAVTTSAANFRKQQPMLSRFFKLTRAAKTCVRSDHTVPK